MKAQKPLVSIIMPTYNVEKYILECLESINNQTYQNYEVIIIDDNSSDSTLLLIGEYIIDKKKFNLIKLTENHWPWFARNIWIKKANWKFVAFVDSDDYCSIDRIEKQVTYMQDNTSIDILWTLYIEIKDGYEERVDKRSIYKEIRDGTAPVHNPTCMLKKSVFERYWLFDTRFEWAEDTYFYLKCYYLWANFDLLEEYLYYYRINENSLSILSRKKQIFATLKSFVVLSRQFKIKLSVRGYLYLLKLSIRYFLSL